MLPVRQFPLGGSIRPAGARIPRARVNGNSVVFTLSSRAAVVVVISIKNRTRTENKARHVSAVRQQEFWSSSDETMTPTNRRRRPLLLIQLPAEQQRTDCAHSNVPAARAHNQKLNVSRRRRAHKNETLCASDCAHSAGFGAQATGACFRMNTTNPAPMWPTTAGPSEWMDATRVVQSPAGLAPFPSRLDLSSGARAPNNLNFSHDWTVVAGAASVFGLSRIRNPFN